MLDNTFFTLINSIIFFFDIFLGLYFTIICLKYLILYISLIILLSIIFTTEFKELEKRFKFTIGRKKKRRQNLTVQFMTIKQFCLDHTKILAYLPPLNQQLVSPLYVVYILANVGFNAYCIVFLMYYKVQLFMMIFGYIGICVQAMLPLTCAFFLIKLNLSAKMSLQTLEKTIYRFDKNALKNCNFLTSYWKCLMYVEFLRPHQLKYFSMTAGPMGPINSQSLLQVNF